MSNKIIVIGHKSPDLDSVASAIAYAQYKNKIENTDIYVAGIAGEPNKETIYVLEKFGIAMPEKVESIADKTVIFVDHNVENDRSDGHETAKIAEVVDHHRIDFKTGEPINFLVRTWGSTCTIIADMFLKNNIEIGKSLAGIMLSGILVDTVITKSPTCAEVDKETIEKLSGLAGIADWKSYGMELFKIRSQVQKMSEAEIIKSDFKDFNFKVGKVGIGQVETVDLSEFDGRDEKLLAKMEELKNEGGYHSVVLFITDIIKEGSKFFAVSDDMKKNEEALGVEIKNSAVFIPGIISRKKQVAPKYAEVFDSPDEITN